MHLIPSRDLRVRPAEVWKALKQRKEIVVTNNGTPIAVMTAVDAETFEEPCETLKRAVALRALEAIHREAVAAGATRLTDRAIAREIKAVRGTQMRIVLDTNVVVAGLLRPYNAPAMILRLVITGGIILVADDRILLEYEEVIRRQQLGINPEAAREVCDFIRDHAEIIVPHVFVKNMPDADDAMFLEVALSAKADYLVTDNMRHFPARLCRGVALTSPSEFIGALPGSNC